MSRASTPAGDAVGSDSRATLDPGATEAAATVPQKPVTRVGRPRDSSVHARILASAAALVVRDGYARVTIEGIAAHAGVGKATIYRRWASKGTLVLEAIASIFSIGAPNTGDVRADLIAHVREIGDTVTNSIYGAAIPGLHADLARDPELGRTSGGSVSARRGRPRSPRSSAPSPPAACPRTSTSTCWPTCSDR